MFPGQSPVLFYRLGGAERWGQNVKQSSLGAGGMASCLREFLALAEDLGSVASTYSSSRDHFLLDSEYAHVHVYALTHMHRIKNKNIALNDPASAGLTLLIQTPSHLM